MTQDTRHLEATPASRVPIVGVGTASLDPLIALLARLQRQELAVVVVFEDRAADGAADALTRATRLQVHEARGGEALRPGHVYLAPDGQDLRLQGGALQVTPRGPGRALPIDTFFRSLAEERRGEAVGVVLGGAGTDGTLGLEALKAADGIALVQDPSTADRDRMPRSALETGCADFTGSAEELGDELSRILAHPYLAPDRPAEGGHELDGLPRLHALLRAAFGHDLSLYKQGTIIRRVERRMALRKTERIDDYLRLVQSSQAELAALYRDLLIGVTSFFRDGEPFDALKASVFPAVLGKRRQDLPVRVWVPGCSTGEEAYSIAIALLEHLGDRAQDLRLQVFGTDIDAMAIERARRGIYPENIALDVSPERLHRFFVKKDGHYQICRRVRDMLVFATQDVTKDPPYSRLDLISCRNVMIYLQAPLQRRVLRIFHYALNPGGFLLLGTSESVGDSTDLFSLADRHNKIYAKRSLLPAAATFDVTVGEGALRGNPEPVRPATPREPRPHATVQQLADRRVLERFGPPGVVVNRDLEVLQFRGRTGPFLDPTPGVATLIVLKLARPEVAIELRTALQRCQREGGPVTARAVLVRTSEGPRVIDIEVTPLEAGDPSGACMLVLFAPASEEPAPPEEPQPLPPERRRLEELEHEILTTKQHLQSTIEELETANEELQSANEELQSANEELQSTNEELETSKEELQSTNEELTTVNDELQTRMEELSQSNDDLHNVLVSIDTALVIVGMDLRIRRFTLSAERLLGLVPGDVGRPVGHLRAFVAVPELEQVVAGVVEHVAPRTLEARGVDGRWYELRMTPYKTTDYTIKGVLLTFVDLDVLRRRGLLGAGDPAAVARRVVGAAPHPTLLLDPGLRVSWVNAAFLRTFQREEADVTGRLVQNLGAPWADPGLHARLERLVTEGVPFADLRLRDRAAGGGPRALVVGGSRIELATDEVGGAALLLHVFVQEEAP
ncbi:MAG: PAS domain-containing protein [Planctomycetes bacterium]|nr:PAS domain-containing protein [Planctomycetota bacterium]